MGRAGNLRSFVGVSHSLHQLWVHRRGTSPTLHIQAASAPSAPSYVSAGYSSSGRTGYMILEREDELGNTIYPHLFLEDQINSFGLPNVVLPRQQTTTQILPRNSLTQSNIPEKSKKKPPLKRRSSGYSK